MAHYDELLVLAHSIYDSEDRKKCGSGSYEESRRVTLHLNGIEPAKGLKIVITQVLQF